MPWDCSKCGAEGLSDSEGACACGQAKSAWTVFSGQTRQLVVGSTKRLQVLVGAGASPLPQGPDPYARVEWRKARRLEVLSRSRLVALAEQGLLPAPEHVALARVFPGDKPSRELELSVIHARREARELRLEAAPELDPEGAYDQWLVFCACEPGEAPSLEGLQVIEVGEEEAPGHAPQVTLSALGRRPKQLDLRLVQPAPALVLPAALFAFGSAFPRPAARALVQRAQEEARRQPERRLAVFGHTDAVGSDLANKRLSDRRAAVVAALLRGDSAGLEGEADEWGLAEYQAILRGLGGDPGAIDGASGPLTKAALRWFQWEHRRDEFGLGAGRPYPELAVDGILGPQTEAALRAAYVAEIAGGEGLPPAAFWEPSTAGCGEFNLREEAAGESAENRRVVVASFAAETPAFPCRAGDPGACALDQGAGLRCSAYRAHVDEAQAAPASSACFSDLRWLSEEGGSAHLSALTLLPDGASARFVVSRSEDPRRCDSTHLDAPPPGEELARIQGEVRGGVAYARWEPARDFDPFDPGDWCQLDEQDEDAPVLSRPPVFRVEAEDGAWAQSGPPALRLAELRLLDAPEGCLAEAVDVLGVPLEFEVREGRAWIEGAAPDPELEVVAFELLERELAPLGAEEVRG